MIKNWYNTNTFYTLFFLSAASFFSSISLFLLSLPSLIHIFAQLKLFALLLLISQADFSIQYNFFKLSI